MRIFLVILILCASFPSKAQRDSLKATQLLQHDGRMLFATLDQFDNVYLVNDGGQIKKINIKGDSLAVYNQVRNFGTVSQLDVSNPLKVLAFYKQFAIVLILDRFLAVRSTLDLKRLGILQPAAIGLSYDNNIWVFDEYDYKLKKVDEQGQLLLQTIDLRNVLPQLISPEQIINQSGMVYLVDPSFGVVVFDIYGALKKKFPSRTSGHVTVSDGNVIISHNGELSITSLDHFRERKYPLPNTMTKAQYFFAGNDRMVVLTEDFVQVFKVEFNRQ